MNDRLQQTMVETMNQAEKTSNDDVVQAEPVLDLDSASDAMPLSAEQRARDSLSLSDTNADANAEIMLISIDGICDRQRLRNALTAVVARHAQLRTVLRSFAGYRGLRQQPLAQLALDDSNWREVDFSGSDNVDAALGALLAQERTRAFDLAHGRVWRAVLCHFDQRRWCLSFAVAPLAADRKSLVTLYRDITMAYSHPEQFAEEEMPLQYLQFVEWRRDLEQGESASEGRAYWQHQEQQQAPDLYLPNHTCHNNIEDADLAQPLLSTLPATLAASLESVAASSQQTVPILIQAAWWALLARISGQPLFAAGWQHDCRRDYSVMDGAVGVFEKILPLVIEVNPDESFISWVARFAAQLESHVQAQEYAPLVPSLIPSLVPSRVASLAAPTQRAHFKAGFQLVDATPVVVQDGIRFACEVLPQSQSEEVFALALQLEIAEQDVPLALSLRHSNRISKVAAERLLQQFVTLLRGLASHAAGSVSDLPLVGAEEKTILLALNQLAPDHKTLPLPLTVPEQIAQWAQTRPEVIALQAPDLVLSYAMLEQQVGQWSRWLQSQGVGRDSIVALRLPRCGRLIVALLAVMRAGAAYLPMDPEWPAARQAAILQDAAASLLLTVSGDDIVDGFEGKVIALDTLDMPDVITAIAPSAPSAASIAPEQAAYVLYTSGSTGAAKGVVIEHRQLSNYVAAATQSLGLERLRHFALTSTVAADLGNTTLFGALVNGATLVVADSVDMQDAAGFSRFIAHHQIDCLKIVPSHLEALLEAPSGLLPATIVLGGEAAPRRLVERIHTQSPSTRLFNHYGPTETTVGVMTHEVDFTLPLPDVLPLTSVMAGCCVVLLDRQQQLVATGVLGELYVGGAQVCRGYLGQRGHSAFIDDPFYPGERLYRTGDLACYLPEGGLQLAGRADHQLKIRGFRIEPAEVEQALLSLPGISAAVVAAQGEAEQRRLIAWVVTDEANRADFADLDAQEQSAQWTRSLQHMLPEAMVPSAMVTIAALPRLGNGKIDLRALPAPVSYTERAYVAPADPVQALLADLFAELLERPLVSVAEDFFDLGGHSLLVIKLVGRIRKALQIEIPPGLVFDHPSVAALAQALLVYETSPGRLQQIASLRQRLAAMTPQERAALQSDALAAT